LGSPTAATFLPFPVLWWQSRSLNSESQRIQRTNKRYHPYHQQQQYQNHWNYFELTIPAVQKKSLPGSAAVALSLCWNLFANFGLVCHIPRYKTLKVRLSDAISNST